MTGERDFDKLMEQQYELKRPVMAGVQTRAEKRQRQSQNGRAIEAVADYMVDDPLAPVKRLEELMGNHRT